MFIILCARKSRSATREWHPPSAASWASACSARRRSSAACMCRQVASWHWWAVSVGRDAGRSCCGRTSVSWLGGMLRHAPAKSWNDTLWHSSVNEFDVEDRPPLERRRFLWSVLNKYKRTVDNAKLSEETPKAVGLFHLVSMRGS